MAIAVLVGLLIWKAGVTAWSLTEDRLRKTSEERLTLYASTLDGALGKLRHLPFTFAQHPAVARLLRGGGDAGGVNRYLESVAGAAGADALYLLDVTGLTVAASNWQEEPTFLGKRYEFRPYFQSARDGRAGLFFAIGVTTGEPGLFLSHPVRDQGDVVGVAVVKVTLEPLQADWRSGGEAVMVSDSDGVVFLSSDPTWKYRTLNRLDPAALARLERERKYEGADLSPIAFESRDGAFQGQVTLAGVDFLVTGRSLTVLDWRLHYLAELRPAALAAWTASLGLLAGLIGLAMLWLYLRERRRKQASERQARDAEAVREANRRLAAEVAERKRTEETLRTTQDELVQAGKLAALGQMSAAIAHEVNQPIAAIRTFAASGRVLMQRQDGRAAAETLEQITAMTDRLATITGQLKSYARKSQGVAQPVVLQDCVKGALVLMEAPLRLAGVSVTQEIEAAPVSTLGDGVRVEQVLVNLLRNALDAVKDRDDRYLALSLRHEDGQAKIVVEDNGPGIAPGDLDRLFDPFFTTKEVGQGVGLGLAISFAIVSDMGGRLRADNRPEGGARFTVQLPLTSGAKAAAADAKAAAE